MLSQKRLKIALLCLMCFTVFCLVVLELTLNDRKLKAKFRRQSKALDKSFDFQRKVTYMKPTRILFKKETRNVLNSHQRAINRSGTVKRVRQNDGSIPQEDYCVLWKTLRNASRGGTRLSPVDNCQKSPKPQNAINIPFDLSKQTLANGTRPKSCYGCFGSEFPPLIENCSVCNTGLGDQADHVELVMVILTTHPELTRRQAIRNTWASITYFNTAPVRHVFLFGRTKVEKDMQLVREENARYGDIIMYDFIDSYANLTLKTLTAMHWATRFCGAARFLLKVDDDMWINVPFLLQTVKRENRTLHTAVGGACRKKATPIRNSKSKWFASRKAYPEPTYPGFCSGTAYVTSLNVARHIISVSPNVPFFYLEDVYVSLCIQRLGSPFHLQQIRGFLKVLGRLLSSFRLQGTISMHQVNPRNMSIFWKLVCNEETVNSTDKTGNQTARISGSLSSPRRTPLQSKGTAVL